MINKEIKVILSEEADEVLQELNNIVGGEKKKSIDSSFHQTLLRSITKVIEMLKKNPFAGNQIPRRLHPKLYSKKYDVQNIWRIELANRWRLIYIITGNKVEVVNFVMDFLDHKRYDKVFGYKH